MASVRSLLAVTTALLVAAPGFGQGPGGGGGGIGQPGQGGQGGQNQQTGGILIDAEGVVRAPAAQQLSPRLLKERREAFAARAYGGDLLAYSERRCVSLVKLEAECARQLQSEKPLTEDLRHLAGLQRIDFLFVEPESRDIVIAGPAEGFAPDVQGRMRGLTTDRPPLHLEDLVVALNAAFDGTSSIGCSIDPEPSRLASMGEFIRNNSSVTSPAVAAKRYERMAQILGMQEVSVFGVPEDSHFANVLVEADFRMKRISLGVEPSGVRGLRSHLSLLKPNGNSIQRWWFVPFYDALYSTEDGTAYHLTGQRAQLLAQEELSSLGGERTDAAFTRATTEQFAQMFTERFDDLAEHSPVFAQLQNLFDLAVIAALLRREDLPGQVGWQMQTFRTSGSELTGSYAVPRHVESASTFRRAGRGMILGLVGGVTIEPDRLLRRFETQAEPALRLPGVKHEALSRPAPASHPWWWD
jgi:hypothetical protein